LAALLIIFYHATSRFAAVPAKGNYDTYRDWPHSLNPLVTFFYEGHSSVALFMVLSGFIFTVGTIGKKVHFVGFMSNRLLRIYPLFLVLVFTGIALHQRAFNPLGFFQTVFGLANTPGALDLGVFSQMFWAIGVEFQFYLLFPLLNAVLNRWGVPAFARLVGSLFIVRMLGWLLNRPMDPNGFLYGSIIGRIDQFLYGMIAAWLFVHYREKFRGWLKLIAAFAVVLGALWFYNQQTGAFSQHAWRGVWPDVEGIMWATLVIVFVATVKGEFWFGKIFAKIGELSFSIYLMHMIIVDILIRYHVWIWASWLSPNENAFATTTLIVVPVVVAIAYFTYNSIEKPFLKFRVKYLTDLPEATIEVHVREKVPA
jgi:peptidoglycan/LPS O-acetylase OafA/YrhL